MLAKTSRSLVELGFSNFADTTRSGVADTSISPLLNASINSDAARNERQNYSAIVENQVNQSNNKNCLQLGLAKIGEFLKDYSIPIAAILPVATLSAIDCVSLITTGQSAMFQNQNGLTGLVNNVTLYTTGTTCAYLAGIVFTAIGASGIEVFLQDLQKDKKDMKDYLSLAGTAGMLVLISPMTVPLMAVRGLHRVINGTGKLLCRMAGEKEIKVEDG